LAVAAVHCGSHNSRSADGFQTPPAGDDASAPMGDDATAPPPPPLPDSGHFNFDSAPPHVDSGVGPMMTCDAGDAGCAVGCGNGKIDPGLNEACDDGNTKPGDGCSADCQLEPNYICPVPGQPCVSTLKCGDGRIGGNEQCDDGNTNAGDGCSATCQVETGWICPVADQPCIIDCGDGILTGLEQCDPPNPGMGCSAACQFEPGWGCAPPAAPMPDAGPPPPSVCAKTVCGNGKKEGNEACDDGNVIDGDGCSATCTLEPDCSTGKCLSKCGDAILLAPEACDDGNTNDGDGCSSTCMLEAGFTCTTQTTTIPAQLNLAVTFRDFISKPINGGVRHEDFESNVYGMADTSTPGLALPQLDTEGKPVLAGPCSQIQPATYTNAAICPWQEQMSTQAKFAQWYRDTPGVNIPLHTSLLMAQQPGGSYVFDSAAMGAQFGLFPLDGKGWTVSMPKPLETTAIADDNLPHDFGFTTEIRYYFQYRGGEVLNFTGDDDVWVYVNRNLGLDLGGLHEVQAMTLTVDAQATALGITKGGLYEIVLFHAERHTTSSNFKLTMTGFAPTSSACHSTCGDGIVAGMEQCDPGMTDGGAGGGYNGCTADCKRGPFCGDGKVNGPEKCDDGVNMTIYSPTPNTTACGPGCMPPGYCGDGKLDALYGEQCDKGAANNDTTYDGCTTKCQLGPRCGDGIVQAADGEQCDDGNTVSNDGCDNNCKSEIPK
jgi:fibro-slime domain-containing protein